MTEDQTRISQLKHQMIAILTVTAWAITAFILAYLIMLGIIAVLGQVLSSQMGISQNVLMVAVSSTLYVLMLALLLFLPRLAKKQLPTLSMLGLQAGPTWKDIGLALPALVIYFIGTTAVMYLVTVLLPWIDISQAQETGLSATTNNTELLWIFMLLVVVGPIVEEVIFRGYLYGRIREAKVPFWLTAIIVSVLFGIAHMQWNVGIDTFVLSMVMCLARELTGSIWTGVLMHMMKNGIAFYLLFVATDLLTSIGLIVF